MHRINEKIMTKDSAMLMFAICMLFGGMPFLLLKHKCWAAIL